jgi:hypothetical protein
MKNHPLIHSNHSFELESFGIKFNSGKIHYGYLKHLETFLTPLRHKPIKVLEFGILDGSSLKMWKEYFPSAQIIGADILEECSQFEEERIKVCIGNLDDPDFVSRLLSENGPFDFIIDDAGHTMSQQQNLFIKSFPCLNDGGLYVIEDLHTSYWKIFDGGIGKPDTTINFLKQLTDGLQYTAFKENDLDKTYEVHCPNFSSDPISYFEENIYSIQFYQSMCLIFKGSYYE